MTARLGWAVPVAGALLIGALAPLLSSAAVIMLMAALVVWLATVLVGFRAGPEGAWHPILLLLTGFAVISVTWNGIPLASTAVADLVLLAALGALVLCWLQDSVRVPLPGWLVGAAAALLAAQLVAQLFVPDPPADPPPSYTPPLPPLVTLAKIELGMLGVPILIGAVASSWRRAGLIVNLWLASAAISAAVATVDSLAGAGIGLSITQVQLAEATRAAGLSLHPNHLALSCSMALPVALHRVALPGGGSRPIAVATVALLLAGILVSGSRVGLIGAVAAVGLTALLIVRLRTRVVAAGLAVVVAILVVASVVPGASSLFVGLERLSGGGRAPLADQARSEQLQESLAIALDHPLTGVGATTILDAHNVPIQFWEAGGVIGVLALILYATGALATGWNLLRDQSLPAGIPELVGALSVSFAVWLIAGLFQSQLGDRYIYVPVGLLLGIQLAARASRPAPERAGPEPARPPAGPEPVGVERIPVLS